MKWMKTTMLHQCSCMSMRYNEPADDKIEEEYRVHGKYFSVGWLAGRKECCGSWNETIENYDNKHHHFTCCNLI